LPEKVFVILATSAVSTSAIPECHTSRLSELRAWRGCRQSEIDGKGIPKPRPGRKITAVPPLA
jgi:hypothetical protein